MRFAQLLYIIDIHGVVLCWTAYEEFGHSKLPKRFLGIVVWQSIYFILLRYASVAFFHFFNVRHNKDTLHTLKRS